MQLCSNQLLTEKNLIKTSVRKIFVDEEALRAFDAASQKPDEVLVLDPVDQVHLVEEVVHPLACVEHQPLNRDDLPVGQDPLVHGAGPTLPQLPLVVEEVGGLLQRLVLEV